MDASNPIIPNTLTTMSNILERQARITRQDFGLLRDKLSTQARNTLAVETRLLGPSDVAEIVSEYRRNFPKAPKDTKQPLVLEPLKKVADTTPTSRKLDSQGRPLHPAGTNNKAGKVHVTRNFGSQPRPMEGVHYLAEVLGRLVAKPTHIYTSGTREGFEKRVEKQLGRTAKPFSVILMDVRGAKGGTAAHVGLVQKYLDQLLPREPNEQWPGATGNLLDGILDGIKVNFKSSAGAPYHRALHLCADMVVSVGLPAAVEMLKSASPMTDFFKKDPEFFLCELKNKTDRYEIDKLADKTRPYCCLPAHWRLLFSLLSQGFSNTHPTFDTVESANAYGHSSAHGGMERRYDWACKATRRGKVIAYGDDALIAVRKDDGVYLVAPDFSQMDGSIHRTDIWHVTRWILTHLQRDVPDADMNFWEALADLWVEFAVNPTLICEGTPVYKKKNSDVGMLSGVPGTTLFNTVKCAAAWDLYLENCDIERVEPLDETRATKFMLKYGLTLKPGTFKPERLPGLFELRHGLVLTSTKFLGLQTIVLERDSGEFVYCPHLPLDEAIQQLMTPREDMEGPVPSLTSTNRTLYDRARGLMVTHGFTQPKIKDALYNLANQIDPAAIALIPQIENGLPPDHVSLPEFAFPDSSGFPDMDFCLSLYSKDEAQPPMHKFYNEVGSIHQEMERLRGDRKQHTERVAVSRGVFGAAILRAPSPEPEPYDPILETAIGAPGKPRMKPLPDAIPPYSQPEVVGGDGPPPKTTPTLFQLLKKVVDKYGGATTIAVASEFMSAEPRRVCEVAQKNGFYYTGEDGSDIVSLSPISTPFRTHATQQREDESRMPELTSADAQAAFHRRKRGLQSLTFKPDRVYIQISDLYGIELSEFRDENDMVSQLIKSLQKHFGYARWRAMLEDDRHLGESLEVSWGGEEWIVAAECECPTRKLARQSIAWAIYLANGYEFEDGPDLANKILDAPDEKIFSHWYYSWDEDALPRVTQEELQRFDRLAAPDIRPLGGESLKLNELPPELLELSPRVNAFTVKIAYDALMALGVANATQIILDNVRLKNTPTPLKLEPRRSTRVDDRAARGPSVPIQTTHSKPKQTNNLSNPDHVHTEQSRARTLRRKRTRDNAKKKETQNQNPGSSGYSSSSSRSASQENVSDVRRQGPPPNSTFPRHDPNRRVRWDPKVQGGHDAAAPPRASNNPQRGRQRDARH